MTTKKFLISFLYCLFGSMLTAQSNYELYLQDGKTSFQAEKYKDAIDYFKSAKVLTSTSSQKETIDALINEANDAWISSLETARNEAEAAEKAALEAKEIAIKQATISEANRLASLANIENDKNNYSDALFLSNDALKKEHEVGVAIPLAHQAFGEAVYHTYKKNLGRHTDPISIFEWTNAGDGFLSCGRDKMVQLWNKQGDLLQVLKGHTDYVLTAKYAPDGQSVLTCSADQTAKVWNLQGQIIANLDLHTEEVLGGVFSQDGTKILTWSRDNSARLWTNKGQPLAAMLHKGNVFAAQFSTDGQKIITRASDNTVRLWDVQGNQMVVLSDEQNYMYHAEFSRDEEQLLTCSATNSVKVWNTKGEMLFNLPHPNTVKYATFSADGQKILSIGGDNEVRIWSKLGDLLHRLTHQKKVNAACFSANGQQVLTASEDQTAKIWNLTTNAFITLDHLKGVTGLKFSPDEMQVMTFAKDQAAKIWTLTGDLVMSLNHQAIAMPQFSKDGQMVLASTDGLTVDLTPLPDVIFKEIAIKGLPALSEAKRLKYGLGQ